MLSQRRLEFVVQSAGSLPIPALAEMGKHDEDGGCDLRDLLVNGDFM